jgi:uracil-DNA glycosylase family 4
MDSIEALREEVIACTLCPRLVEYRQRVADTKRRMYREWDYWGRPIPGFGDPEARVLMVGLAPAAHGGNRTGRVFTGDRSGDWVYGTLHKFGFASQPTSVHRDDGMALEDAYITAVVRCAPPSNKPLREELLACRPYLLRELGLLKRLQVVVVFGKIAFDAYLAACNSLGQALPSPRPKFGHGATYALPSGINLVASYHPSQQNTQTGRLTTEMFESIFASVRRLLEQG